MPRRRMLARAPLPGPRICEIQPGDGRTPNRRRRPRGGRRGRDRVPVRAVRRHAREAEREAGPGAAARGPAQPTAPGFAGFAAGDIGQTPDNPDLIAMPDVGSFTRLPWKPEIGWFACDATVEGEAWPYCPRTILRRQIERAARRRLRVQDRLRARVLPRAPDRGRRDRDRRPARHARAALLRHPRADPLVRLRRRRRPQRQLARLGDVRDRPRGRQRPVRAELRLRRRAHDLRPRGLLPLHGRGDGPGARADRDLHAEAVRPPDRQRLPTST